MRGDDRQPEAMFGYIRPEQRVPADDPLRRLREMVDAVLRDLSPELARLYPEAGGPSIPPRSSCGPCSCSCRTRSAASGSSWSRSTTPVFRWFVDLGVDGPVWDPTVLTKNRERLLRGDIARAFLEGVVGQAQAVHLSRPNTSPWVAP